MKQHITVKQLIELTDKEKEELREWWKPKEADIFRFGDEENPIDLKWEMVLGDATWDNFDEDEKIMSEEYESVPGYPLLSIGQMIEFLYQHETVVIESEDREGPLMGWFVGKPAISRLELVDALWEKVKSYLTN